MKKTGFAFALAFLATSACATDVPAGSGEGPDPVLLAGAGDHAAPGGGPLDGSGAALRTGGVPGAIPGRGTGGVGTGDAERGGPDAEEADAGAREAIRRMLGDGGGESIPVEDGALPDGVEAALDSFYAQRDHRPAWSTPYGLEGRGTRALRALEDARLEGLDPERYRVTRIRQLAEFLERRDSEARSIGPGHRQRLSAHLDLLLTLGLLRHARDLARGALDPRVAGDAWQMGFDEPSLEALLSEAADAGDPGAVLRPLRPHLPHYRALVEALARFRARADAGGWPALPVSDESPALLREGDRDRVVTLLRARLHLDEEGRAFRLAGPGTDRPEEGGEPDVFDASLAEAVRHFQRRHGLPADGVVGPETLEALNVPVEDRIRTLELNLDRWRWVPRDFEERYILVNVAGFELEVMEGAAAVLSMRVVVGEPARQTPSFRDRVSFIVLSPWWYVPESIARSEILPRAEEDDEYLERNGYERLEDVPGVPLRQKPGGQNPLGDVKFMFPNAFNVYLHDSPVGTLFDRATRAFSHGCVRLEEPWKLAEYVLRDHPEWPPERIRSEAAGGREVEIALPTALPIYIVYLTAGADEDGSIHFHPDIYGRDRALEPQNAALASGPPGSASRG